MSEGRMTKCECKTILLLVPKVMMPGIDLAVRIEDSDRSKFIRNAIREKLQKHGIISDDAANAA